MLRVRNASTPLNIVINSSLFGLLDNQWLLSLSINAENVFSTSDEIIHLCTLRLEKVCHDNKLRLLFTHMKVFLSSKGVDGPFSIYIHSSIT